MPRQKVAKTAKTTKKVNTKSRPKAMALSNLEVMEKEFSTTPAKIISHSRKELATLKQQEKKLKTELKKAQAQKKIAKNKRVTLTAKSKSKSTATSKKLLSAAKQAYDKASNAITEITSRYDAIKMQVKELTAKQTRFNAIAKLIAQFEKQWDLKAKKSSASAKPKKASKKPKVSNTPHSELDTLKSTIENPIMVETQELEAETEA